MVDFVLHFVCSFIIVLLSSLISRNLKFGIILTLSVGILKELFDLIIQNEIFSLTDLSYDIIGTALGVVLAKHLIT